MGQTPKGTGRGEGSGHCGHGKCCSDLLRKVTAGLEQRWAAAGQALGMDWTLCSDNNSSGGGRVRRGGGGSWGPLAGVRGQATVSE